jgi:hypothetical protein
MRGPWSDWEPVVPSPAPPEVPPPVAQANKIVARAFAELLSEHEAAFDLDQHVRESLAAPDPLPYSSRYTDYLRSHIAITSLETLARDRGPVRFQVTLCGCTADSDHERALFRALSPDGRPGVVMLDGEHPSWLTSAVEDLVPFLTCQTELVRGTSDITVAVSGYDIACAMLFDWTPEQFTIADPSTTLHDTIRRCALSSGLDIMEGEVYGHDILPGTTERVKAALEWATAGRGRLPVAPYSF